MSGSSGKSGSSNPSAVQPIALTDLHSATSRISLEAKSLTGESVLHQYPPSPQHLDQDHFQPPVASSSASSTRHLHTSGNDDDKDVDKSTEDILRDSAIPADDENAREVSDLPPVDGGRRAWAYLISATVLETLVWGLPLSYGVFLTHYQSLYPTSLTLLPQVGTISTGIMYLLLPPLALYLAKHPRQRPWSMWLGNVMIAGGMVGAGMSTSAGGLVGTQGVMYALGGIFLYCPVTSYMFEWWQKRRGLASGILFSGTGLGGLTIPFISSALLSRFGHRTTCISFAIAYAILLSITIPFIQPRLPLPPPRNRNRDLKGKGTAGKKGEVLLSEADRRRDGARLDWGFLRRKAFWLLFGGVVLQGLGGFVPGTYLPSYADTLHLGSTAGTLSLALMNLARIPGQILIGHLSDKTGPRKLIIGMAIMSALSVYVIWGAATGEATLLVFSMMFGAFAGSYTALFPKFIAIVSENDPELPPILYAFFSFARGIGNIASGPVSVQLLALKSRLHAKGGYGVEGYGVLILFTGAMLLASGVGAGYKGLKRN